MTDLLHIKRQKSIFIEKLRHCETEAQEKVRWASKAANDIQRVFRGSIVRGIITFKHFNANEVQRVFRGHTARRKVKQMKKTKIEYRLSLLKNFFAVQIQRSLRGFYSRKYRANHNNRKAFIANMLTSAESIRNQLAKYAEEQTIQVMETNRNKKREAFYQYAKNLHHLTSTKHIRGVFNPSQEFLEIPTVDDVPVEDHIRGAVKDLLRTRGITKRGLVLDCNGSKKVPLKLMKNRLSLQASAPYDAIEKELKSKKLLLKVLTREKGDWFAGGKTNIINHNETPISTGDPYIDPYANPLLIRGVPKDQEQFKEVCYTRKPLFVKTGQIIDKPFYSRTGGNKSSVLPNDSFEAIADAQESGGVTSRHLGKTVRFGVPDCCDNRGMPESVLPSPPPRSSNFRPVRPKIQKTMTIPGKKITSSLEKKTVAQTVAIDLENEEIPSYLLEDPYASDSD